MLFQTYPEFQPVRTPEQVASEVYVPKIFGFRLHPSAHSASLKAKQSTKTQTVVRAQKPQTQENQEK